MAIKNSSARLYRRRKGALARLMATGNEIRTPDHARRYFREKDYEINVLRRRIAASPEERRAIQVMEGL
jgi:hypothetical protein